MEEKEIRRIAEQAGIEYDELSPQGKVNLLAELRKISTPSKPVVMRDDTRILPEFLMNKLSHKQKEQVKKARTKYAKGVAMSKIAEGRLAQFQVAEKYAATAKTTASFILPAILLIGGLSSAIVLWDWFTTGYHWVWAIVITLILIIVIRRMK